ncbi:MAG: hypothetical protein ABIJ59_17270 [Pseudomonadota bacterium]
MIELFSNEFWIAILFLVQFFLVVFLFLLVKKIKFLNSSAMDQVQFDDDNDNGIAASRSASGVIEMLEPLVREARKTAIRFDEQIKEKKQLLKELNNALDTRIININLLLSRAQTQQKKLVEQLNDVARVSPVLSPAFNPANSNYSADMVPDQQHQIIQMHDQQFDTDTIAQKLSIPKGEVQMVIDLKKKFLEMEKSNR